MTPDLNDLCRYKKYQEVPSQNILRCCSYNIAIFSMRNWKLPEYYRNQHRTLTVYHPEQSVLRCASCYCSIFQLDSQRALREQSVNIICIGVNRLRITIDLSKGTLCLRIWNGLKMSHKAVRNDILYSNHYSNSISKINSILFWPRREEEES